MALKTNHIYQGHALEVLKTFPDESIDCVVTSPPYWSLRAYGTEPQIWDGNPECEHEWEDVAVRKQRGKTVSEEAKEKDWKRASRSANPGNIPRRSQFCLKCSAWLGELGLEPSFRLYIKHLCDIFDEVRRVLAPHGTVWVVIGDSFYGSGAGQKDTGKHSHIPREQITFEQQSKPTMGDELPKKCMVGIPERFMLEMVERGWIVRNKIIWYKPAALPESVKDRFTIDFENVYLFTKNPRYYFKQQFELTTDATRNGPKMFSPIGGSKYTGRPEDTLGDRRFSGKPVVARGNRNRRCVWKIGTGYFKEAHFAVFPVRLIEGPIDAGCPKLVCTKCGKPKMPIMKTMGTDGRYKSQGKFTDESKDKPEYFSVGHTGRCGINDFRLVGWTSCDCVDYYCNSCETFIYKEVIEYLVREDALQRDREKKRSEKNKLAKESTETQGTRTERKRAVDCNGALHETDLFDVWKRILREAKPADMFKRMRDAVTNKGRNPTLIQEEPSQKREASQLEGRKTNDDTGICDGSKTGASNDNKTGLYNGASSGHGETSEEVSEKERIRSPQKRNKRRQPDREFRSGHSEPSSWRDCLPSLWENIRNKIVCPVCMSDEVTIEHHPFRNGIVLDPFLGSGTVGLVAKNMGIDWVGIELKEEYVEMAHKRIDTAQTRLGEFI